MKGLLIKDIRLILGQKRFLLVMLLISAAFVLQGEQAAAGIGYMTILTGTLTIMTISYDEYNNGNAFLFTMPISRRGYAVEKYVLGMGLGAAASLLITVCAVVFGQMRHIDIKIGEFAAVSAGTYLVLELMLAVMLPLMFKYGAERGRLAFMVFMIVCVMMILGIGRLTRGVAIWAQSLAWLKDIGPAGLFAMAVLALVVCLCISILISIRIMEKKQF